MIQYVLIGAGLAFAAVVQPGPLQAFLLARVASAGWKRTLPACFAPLISDGPIALVSVLVLGHLSGVFQQVLRGAGGFYLLYLAWLTFLDLRKPPGTVASPSAPRTFVDAVVVNLLNPNPYLGWMLVLGPSVIAAWDQSPSSAVVLLAAFYGTMVVGLAAFILAVGTSRFLGAQGRRVLVAVSATILAGLGLFLLATSVLRLWGS